MCQRLAKKKLHTNYPELLPLASKKFLSTEQNFLTRNARGADDQILPLVDRNSFRMSFGKKKRNSGDEIGDVTSQSQFVDRNNFRMSFGKRSSRPSMLFNDDELMLSSQSFPNSQSAEGIGNANDEPSSGSSGAYKYKPMRNERLTLKRLDRNLFPLGFGRR